MPEHPLTGIISYWNSDCGFGFVRRDDGKPELFVHLSNIEGAVDYLAIGRRTRFAVATNSRSNKPAAQSVTLIETG